MVQMPPPGPIRSVIPKPGSHSPWVRSLVLRIAVKLHLKRLAWRMGYLPGCCAHHDPEMR